MDPKLQPDPLGKTWWQRRGAVVLGILLPIVLALGLALYLRP
jgi:hypothetical protein